MKMKLLSELSTIGKCTLPIQDWTYQNAMKIVTVGCITSMRMRTSEYAHNSVRSSSISLAHLEQMVLMGKMALMEATVQTG